MAKVFVQETDSEGVVSYREVELSEVVTPEDVPDEVIRQSKSFKEVLSESIDRKKKLQAFAQNKDEPEEPAQQERPASANKPTPEIDYEALVAQVEQRVQAKLSEAEQAKAQRKSEIDALMAETRLPETARPALEAVDNQETRKQIAAALANAGLRFSDTPGGGAGDTGALKNRAFALLGLDE